MGYGRVTAWARYNLITNIIKLDKYVVYADTDSCKLKEGYNKKVIENYNKSVESRVKFVSKFLDIPYEKFSPTDIKGNKHLLGLFELDGKYDEFITQGAKKYAYKDDSGIHITVSGVPKRAACGLKSLEDFQDNYVFRHKDSGKNMLVYNDTQISTVMKDYLGNIFYVADKSGVCILPDTYTLSKSLEYANLLSDNSSARAIYKEGK